MQSLRYWTWIIAGALSLGACDDPKETDQATLIEYVKIEGRCHEDHTQVWGDYRGSIVHWFDESKDKHLRYGSVMQSDDISKMLDESIEHPNRYEPPFIVDFWDIPAEMFDKQQMVLRGVSSKVEANAETALPGYESTCEVAVVERLHEFPPAGEAW